MRQGPDSKQLSAPSPFVGRMTVLVFTALSVSLFAAAVFRVTRSLAAAVLGEIVAFGVLISVAGNEPMHPGTLIVLVISVLVFALASLRVRSSSQVSIFPPAGSECEQLQV